MPVVKSQWIPKDKLANAMLVFWLDETGAVSIEYGLIATLIAVAIFGAVGLIAPELTPIFDEIRDELRAG